MFVDIEPETLNLDPARIEAAITNRTKAILLVHTFGCPAELPAILEIARQHHLCVIEDACEAIGAEFDGRKVGGWGDAGVFAFYPNKQITTGEGGMVVTEDPRIASKLRALRNQGRTDSGDWFQHSELGYNYRLPEMNCALGISQLKRIEAILSRREEIAGKYHERLRGIENLRLPALEAAAAQIELVRLRRAALGRSLTQIHRDWIMHEMHRRGIGCARYFAPIHLQPAYRSACQPRSDLRVTEFEASRCLALPFFNRLQDEQIDEVCENLGELLHLAGRKSTEELSANPAANVLAQNSPD